MFDFKKLKGFEWDKGNLEHIKKRGVDYKEAEQVFFNKPFLVNVDEEHSQLEKRFQALGQTGKGRLIYIAFTLRKNKIRPISVRDQSKKERKEFKEKGGGI